MTDQPISLPRVVYNSGNNEWYTPVNYINSVKKVFGGDIELDPASCFQANKTVLAKRYYDKELNGLSMPWEGTVFLNPPYARGAIDAFIYKLQREIPSITQFIVLVNNATDTDWCRRLASISDVAVFTRRIKFLDESGQAVGSPTQGQVFFYRGQNTDGFCSEFSQYGWVAHTSWR